MRSTPCLDFVDAPLVYQAFFAASSRKTACRRAGWRRRRCSSSSASKPEGDRRFRARTATRTGSTPHGLRASRRRCRISNSYRVGASYRATRAQDGTYDDVNSAGTPVTDAFTATAKMWEWISLEVGAQRQYRRSQLQVPSGISASQGRRAACFRHDGRQSLRWLSINQSGWYVQGAYQFMPRWRVGLRYEELNTATRTLDWSTAAAYRCRFPRLAENDPKRTTAMIDFSPSEFSRFRLQFARDEARFNEADNQIFLQYIMSSARTAPTILIRCRLHTKPTAHDCAGDTKEMNMNRWIIFAVTMALYAVCRRPSPRSTLCLPAEWAALATELAATRSRSTRLPMHCRIRTARSAAEPGRAHAQRRSGDLHRRRT